MATKTLWTNKNVTKDHPEIYSTVTCSYERSGNNLKISITTKNYMDDRYAWRNNRWAMDVSINGTKYGKNIQIKPVTSGIIGTHVYTKTTSVYTVPIGNKTSIPISIYYYDTGWSSSRNIYDSFKTLSGTLSGIPSLPSVSISANQAYPNKTHNSLKINYSVSGSAQYVRIYLDGKKYSDVKSSPCTITGLKPNTKHTVYARAYGSGDFGKESNSITFTTFVSPVSVSSVKLGDVQPFSATVYCNSSNAGNTDLYEYALCDKNKNVIKGAFTTKNTYYTFTGLSEEKSYYIRCRVKTKGSGAWSGYIYSPLFGTPADQARGYVKIGETWKQGKIYVKVNGSWVKSKKIYVKKNNSWNISKNS